MPPLPEIKTADDVVKALGLEKPAYWPANSRGTLSDDTLWIYYVSEIPERFIYGWRPRDYFGDDAACMALLDYAIGKGMEMTLESPDKHNNQWGCRWCRPIGSNEDDEWFEADRRTAVIRCILAWHRQRKEGGK